MTDTLTPKQRRFVEEFIKDLNATQAVIRAGYSEKGASVQGSQLLANIKVSEAIAEAKAARSKRTQIDADYVLRQAVKIHKRCMAEVRPVMLMGKQLKDEEGRPVYGFDAKGAVTSLQLVGKHVDVQAFKENLDVNNKISGPAKTEFADDEEAARVYSQTMKGK